MYLRNKAVQSFVVEGKYVVVSLKTHFVQVFEHVTTVQIDSVSQETKTP